MKDRPVSELTFRHGRAVIPAASPYDIIQVLASILERCALPAPFKPGTRPIVQPWSPRLDAGKLTFPIVLWKIVHTVPSSQTPSPKETFAERTQDKRSIIFSQQNFEHLIQFECISGTQQEAHALEWWLVKQVLRYSQNLADVGAQHIRYHEAREDFLTTLGDEKYASRAVRFHMTTALVFNASCVPLARVILKTAIKSVPTIITDTVIRGEDTLSHSHVDSILSVTSEDESTYYLPTYDPHLGTVIWETGQAQPAQGASYKVTYVYYGDRPIDQEVIAE